ncbi:MAG: hypothetical protein RLZZ316_658 [Bacteroidota bacterium]|jgi:1-acyl-sn-glycerol-3-phosphate acyltransferase
MWVDLFFMLYRFVKILMTLALRIFYKNAHVSGLEKIPARGACILLANHPSSLMDAALLGLLIKRPVYFFARGDVFINPLVIKILSWLHMHPVHNHEGGRRTLHHNSASFMAAGNLLQQGAVLLFFPEGISHTEPQLQQFKKGIFRIAMDAVQESDYSLNIPLLPLGITYTHPTHCFAKVYVQAGALINTKNYVPLFQQNPATCFLKMAKDCYEATEPLVLHIKEAGKLSESIHCLSIQRTDTDFRQWPWLQQYQQFFLKEKEIANKINNASADFWTRLQTTTTQYFSTLAAYKLSDKAVIAKETVPLFILIILAPVYTVAWLLTGIPVAIARSIANKKVYRLDFYSWIFVATAALLSFIWWLVLLLIALSCFGIAGWLLLPAYTILGCFAIYYFNALSIYRLTKQKEALPQNVRQQLTQQRQELQLLLA